MTQTNVQLRRDEHHDEVGEGYCEHSISFFYVQNLKGLNLKFNQGMFSRESALMDRMKYLINTKRSFEK
jgi:hypothetical protein